ncbi:MAG: Tetratricopeptide 2 repeat-containing protein [Chitinophagaceae bacterium]|nr:Tetratricopeptide 2 repeat-containing protein [Chitinophagaceae bacterium]
MPDQLIQRAELLIQQHKFQEAEKVLADLLSQYPTDIRVLALMAEVQLQQDKTDEAETLINSAIGLSPDIGYLYYLKSRVAINRKKYDDAEKDLKEAISIEPTDADFYALLASIKLMRKNYDAALETANTALEHDPENISALNTRSTALLKLDRHEESHQTIEGALREDPNNAHTHANYGWNLLERGDHTKALKHFSEALKNDPNSEYAQIGMAEALKARYIAYRWFLKYSFWISNLTAKYQWVVFIGFIVGFRLLRVLASNSPSLSPYLTPLIIVIAFVAFSTWVITPISNLFLRFNKYGKHLLSPKEILSSNLVGISAFVFIAGVLTYFITQNVQWLAPAALGFSMMLPLGVVFDETKYKYALPAYTLALGLIGTLAVYRAMTGPELFSNASLIYVLGITAFQWVYNYMMIKESNR